MAVMLSGYVIATYGVVIDMWLVGTTNLMCHAVSRWQAFHSETIIFNREYGYTFHSSCISYINKHTVLMLRQILWPKYKYMYMYM